MTPTDPLYAQQWHLTALGNIETIWDEYSGAGIHVVVYDSGVQSIHPDLAANYDASLHIVIDDVLQDGNPDVGGSEHGTQAAGLIAMAANNDEGGVGVAWGASLTGVNVSDYLFSVAGFDGIKLLKSLNEMSNFDVANHSWGRPPLYLDQDNLAEVPADNVALQHLVCAIVSRDGREGLGTIVVQSGGNIDMDAQGYGLNASRYTITVAGLGPDGFAADYSAYGACMLVAAPTNPTYPVPEGQGLLSTDLTGADGATPGDYAEFGGTSGAAPIVTGVVALMLDANADLGWRDVQNILAASATHTGSEIGEGPSATEDNTWFINGAGDWNGGGWHFSEDYGYGVVNAYNAVRMAEVWSLFETAQTFFNEIHWGPWSISTPQAITDAAALSTVFAVDDPGNPNLNLQLEHVTVTVNLTHPNFTQLRIVLVSPDGTEVELYDGSFLDGSSTDSAFASGMAWTYGIDSLRGEDTFGDWTVRIEDTVAGGTGTLDWVNLDFYGKTPSADNVYHYTDEFLDMAAIAGEAGRDTLADTNGGSDWIDAAAVTGNVMLNLNAGMTASVGGTDWFTIAAGATIENAVTGDGDDTLTGNGAANMLYGMRGNDTLEGSSGNDTLRGGAGNDVLTGGAGRDLLFGDADSDEFNFDSKSETKKGGQRDKIMHFERGQDDIDLEDIDAKSGSGNQNFKWIGKSKFHDEKGELRYIDKGSTVIVQGDVNGDGKADFEIFVAASALAKGDFFL